MPGTTLRRRWPEQSGFDNLAIAGDWTRTPINAACVEAAAMSGLLAARFITGIDTPIAGARDFPITQGPDQPPAAPGLPAMVEQIGITAGPGPLNLSGCRSLFLLAAAAEPQLRAWCQSMFVNPSNGALDIRPIVPAVLLQWCQIARVDSLNPDFGPRLGWFPENDVGFWIPVGLGREIDGWFVVSEIGLAPALLLVDHPTGLVSGREVWGYPKQWGSFVNPKGPTDPGPFVAQAYAVTEKGGPSQMSDLFTVTRVGSDAPEAVGKVDDALKALHELLLGAAGEKLLPGIKLADELVDMAFGASPRQFFLKETRSGDAPFEACYQAVTASSGRFSYKSMSFMPGPFELRVLPRYSHPICQVLGMNPVSTADFAVWVEFDTSLDNAVVIAGAGAEETP